MHSPKLHQSQMNIFILFDLTLFRLSYSPVRRLSVNSCHSSVSLCYIKLAGSSIGQILMTFIKKFVTFRIFNVPIIRCPILAQTGVRMSAVPPVIHQGKCGSCYAVAAARMLTSRYVDFDIDRSIKIVIFLSIKIQF